MLIGLDGTVAPVQHNVVTLIQSSEAAGVNLSEDMSASGTGRSGGMGGGMGLIMMLLLLVLMMTLMRPRQDKEGEKFRNALQLDQEVVTGSGIFGKIKAIDDVSVILEIGQNMRIKVDKRYVNPIPTVQPVAPKKKSRKERKAEQEAAAAAEKK